VLLLRSFGRNFYIHLGFDLLGYAHSVREVFACWRGGFNRHQSDNIWNVASFIIDMKY
jgi:hypothetical protein